MVERPCDGLIDELGRLPGGRVRTLRMCEARRLSLR